MTCLGFATRVSLFAGVAVAAAAQGQVVSHLTFESIADGATINSITENGNFWFAFAATTGEYPQGSSTQPDTYPDGYVSTISGDFSPGFGYLEVEGDAFELPDTGWTIETHVRFDAVGGFQTMLGRDRDLLEDRTPLADLYFQKNSADRFSCSMVTSIVDNPDGTVTVNRPYTESTTVAQAGVWYHVAAVYDPGAQTLNLYVNGDLESSVPATENIVDVTDAFSQFWSVGRGSYDGNPVDGLNGLVDEMRISQDVLTPAEFLYDAPCFADLDGDEDADSDDVLVMLGYVDDGCEPFDRTLTFVDANPATNSGPSANFAAEPLEDGLFGPRAQGTNGQLWEASGVASGNEDVAEIFTTISGLTPAQEYGVYVNFYDVTNNTTENWNVRAGFTSGNTTLFAADDGGATLLDAEPSVLASDFEYPSNPPLFDDGGNRMLRAGYVGPATANGSGEITVYIDDMPAGIGANARTWYDGVSYGAVPPPPCPADYNDDGSGDFFDFLDYMVVYDEGCE